jgi:hypothetical protein
MSDDSPGRIARFFGKVPATAAIVLVNGVSISGQVIFWRSHLPWPLVLCIGFAIALESVAIYLAYHASLAELAQDSAFKLRIMSYLFGAIIGAMNASHFLNHGHLTAASIGMGLLSASSPWLWAIHSRREARDELKARGLIDDRAVRLGLRWFFYPGQTFGVFRQAVWNGESNPAAAIRAWEAREDAKRANANADAEREAAAAAERERLALAANPDTDRLSLAAMASKADRVRYALRCAPVGEASTYVAWLTDRGVTDVNAAYVRQIRSSESKRLATTARGKMRAISGGGVAP